MAGGQGVAGSNPAVPTGQRPGAVSLGFAPEGKRRIRRKVTGRTKTEVKDKLKALRCVLDAGIHSSPS
jgi:hypothetical protein